MKKQSKNKQNVELINQFYKTEIIYNKNKYEFITFANDIQKAEQIIDFLWKRDYYFNTKYDKIQTKLISENEINDNAKIYFIHADRIFDKYYFNSNDNKELGQIAYESITSNLDWKNLQFEEKSRYQNIALRILNIVFEEMESFNIKIEEALSAVMSNEFSFKDLRKNIEFLVRRPKCSFCNLRHWPGETTLCAY